MSQIMGLPADDLLKTCNDMTVLEKGHRVGYKAAVDDVMRIVEYADQKAGAKTYIVMPYGRFYSQAQYIKEKVLELLEEKS